VASLFEFGEFRLDCARVELLREGQPLKLERKPMELLVLLAERAGELVTREEIAARLWGSEVFVDTEHGINTAIRKIRQALREDPQEPCFLFTLSGRGYRLEANAVAAPPPFSPVAVPDSPPPGAGEMPRAKTHTKPQTIASAVVAGPRRGWPAPWVAMCIILAAVVVLVFRSSRANALFESGPITIHSLAVLPLENLSGDPSQDYVAAGMTDELTTMLAKASNLRVVSRTSALQFEGKHAPLQQIASQLGVDAVLEGSVSKIGDLEHVNLQLVAASSDANLWAESYDRAPQDAATLPSEAAMAVAKKLNSAAPLAEAKPRHVNPEAHDAYLRGWFLWHYPGRFTNHNEQAAQYFTKAVTIQPDYALGWAGLANAKISGVIQGEFPESILPPAMEAAVKSVQLDDTDPRTHLALGTALFLNDWDFMGADHEFLRAIELDPKFAQTYRLRQALLVAQNRHAESLEAEKKADDLEPFESVSELAHAYESVHQYDDSLASANQRLVTNLHDPALFRVMSDDYRCKGMPKESADALANYYAAGGDQASAAAVRAAYRSRGMQGVGDWELEVVRERSKKRYVSPMEIAYSSARAGKHDETLDALEQSLTLHSPALIWLEAGCTYDLVRHDPRFKRIVAAVGLPPVQ
jgi:TolB-like protein/DNA-binding winged helix-turn-helix (wHTH) protein